MPFLLEVSPHIHTGGYPGIADGLMVILTRSVFFLNAFLEPWDYRILLALWNRI